MTGELSEDAHPPSTIPVRTNSMDTERNRKMFYQIAEAIEEYPEMHNQTAWFSFNEDPIPNLLVAGRQINWCGTQQCIAGWALALDNRVQPSVIGADSVTVDCQIGDNYYSYGGAGAKLLGLTIYETDILFSETAHPINGDWPATLRMIGDGAEIDEVIR